MSGKGSRYRPVDKKKFDENFEKIFGKKKKMEKPCVCPLCDKKAMVRMFGELSIQTPPNIPGGDIVIKNCSWEECTKCHEKILEDCVSKAIEKEAAKRKSKKYFK